MRTNLNPIEGKLMKFKFKMSRKNGKYLSDWLDNPNNWNDGFDNHPRLLTEIRDIIYEQAYQTKIKRGPFPKEEN